MTWMNIIPYLEVIFSSVSCKILSINSRPMKEIRFAKKLAESYRFRKEPLKNVSVWVPNW